MEKEPNSPETSPLPEAPPVWYKQTTPYEAPSSSYNMQPVTSVSVAPPPCYTQTAQYEAAPSSSYKMQPVTSVTVAPPPCYNQTTPYEAPSSSYNMQPVTTNTVTVVRTQPHDYLCLAIFVTLCCCWPLGCVGIVFSCVSSTKFNRGDDVGAQEAANCARIWSLAGLFIGVVAIIVIFLCS